MLSVMAPFYFCASLHSRADDCHPEIHVYLWVYQVATMDISVAQAFNSTPSQGQGSTGSPAPQSNVPAPRLKRSASLGNMIETGGLSHLDRLLELQVLFGSCV